jgi:hypothetical protein
VVGVPRNDSYSEMVAWTDRAWILSHIAATGLVAWTSPVGLDLWFVAGPAALLLGIGYILALTVVLARPRSIRAHVPALLLGLLFWAGRGTAFLPLGLWGAVAERAAMAISFSALHLIAIRRETYLDGVASSSSSPPPSEPGT